MGFEWAYEEEAEGKLKRFKAEWGPYSIELLIASAEMCWGILRGRDATTYRGDLEDMDSWGRCLDLYEGMQDAQAGLIEIMSDEEAKAFQPLFDNPHIVINEGKRYPVEPLTDDDDDDEDDL